MQHELDPGLLFAPGHAVDTRVKLQVLAHRQVLVEAEALGHVPDALLDPFGLGGDVEADHAPLAAARIEDPA